jgi:hypothetical protein
LLSHKGSGLFRGGSAGNSELRNVLGDLLFGGNSGGFSSDASFFLSVGFLLGD